MKTFALKREVYENYTSLKLYNELSYHSNCVSYLNGHNLNMIKFYHFWGAPWLVQYSVSWLAV